MVMVCAVRAVTVYVQIQLWSQILVILYVLPTSNFFIVFSFLSYELNTELYHDWQSERLIAFIPAPPFNLYLIWTLLFRGFTMPRSIWSSTQAAIISFLVSFFIMLSSLSFDNYIIYLRKYKNNRQNAQTYGSIIVHFIYFRKNKKENPGGPGRWNELCNSHQVFMIKNDVFAIFFVHDTDFTF